MSRPAPSLEKRLWQLLVCPRCRRLAARRDGVCLRCGATRSSGRGAFQDELPAPRVSPELEAPHAKEAAALGAMLEDRGLISGELRVVADPRPWRSAAVREVLRRVTGSERVLAERQAWLELRWDGGRAVLVRGRLRYERRRFRDGAVALDGYEAPLFELALWCSDGLLSLSRASSFAELIGEAPVEASEFYGELADFLPESGAWREPSSLPADAPLLPGILQTLRSIALAGVVLYFSSFCLGGLDDLFHAVDLRRSLRIGLRPRAVDDLAEIGLRYRLDSSRGLQEQPSPWARLQGLELRRRLSVGEALALATAQLHDPHPRVREAARWLLASSGVTEAIRPLPFDPGLPPEERAAALRLLARGSLKLDGERLLWLLEKDSREPLVLRVEAAALMPEIFPREQLSSGLEALAELLASPNTPPELRRAAILSYGRMGGDFALLSAVVDEALASPAAVLGGSDELRLLLRALRRAIVLGGEPEGRERLWMAAERPGLAPGLRAALRPQRP